MTKKKYLIMLVCSFVLLISASVVTGAEIVPNGNYRIRNVKSGLYLDCTGAVAGGNLQQKYYPEWEKPQEFRTLSMTNGNYTVFPTANERVVANVVNGSSSNGDNIALADRNATDAQKWNFIQNSDGSFRIASKCSNSQKVMTVQYASMNSGENVFQYQYNATKNDEWNMELQVEEGCYLIRNKVTGKYLTVFSNYVFQLPYEQSKFQQFIITPSSNGYYDIAPLIDTNWSVGVSGWDTGSVEEGANIIANNGQSSEGERWKFLLNSQGCYRIVSEISDDKMAISVPDSNQPYTVSCTYNSSINADWELIRVEPIISKNNYPSEGRHISIDSSVMNYVPNYISKEDWTIFLSRLDTAYDLYAELVGSTPHNGEKIGLVASIDEKEPMWVHSGGKIIYWNPSNIISILPTISKDNRWSFGVLHEMGHLFDLDERWTFDRELMANLKMAYVLNCLDGKFLTDPNSVEVNSYSRLITYYKINSVTSYFNCWQSRREGSKVYSNDSITYVLLENISATDAWFYFKEAFRTIVQMSEYQIPDTCSGKYNLLIDAVDNASGGVFKSRLLTNYSEEITYAVEHNFSNASND